MKFSCSVEDLRQSLSGVSHALSTKGSLPVLSYVLVTVVDNQITLSTTNLELSIKTSLPAKVEGEGSVCAPGRLLTELTSSLPAGELLVQVKDNILEVESLNVKSKLNGIDAKEFPRLSVPVKEAALSLPPALFCRSLPQVIFSAATDESRPVLTGILLEVTGESLLLVGVDGFRLSQKRLKLPEKAAKDFRVVVPARTLAEIGRLISSEESLGIILDDEENQIIFKTPHFEVSSRLIEGDYPDYQKIIPASFLAKVTVATEEFSKSIKLASLFARDSSNIIKLTLRPQESSLVLGANTPEIGESETKISAKIEGEALTVAFNNRYLSDCLGSMGGEETTFQASGQLSPGLFANESDDSYFHIIMPVRVQE